MKELFFVVFWLTISFSVESKESKFVDICNKIDTLNVEAIDNKSWSIHEKLDAENKLGPAIRLIRYRDVEIPVAQGELMGVDREASGTIETLKLTFSEGITEVRVIQNDEGYVHEVGETLGAISKNMEDRYLAFIRNENFIAKVKWYTRFANAESSCLSDPVGAWSKIYVENVLVGGTMTMDAKAGLAIFGDGLIFKLRGYEGYGFVSQTEDRKYLIQVVGYKK